MPTSARTLVERTRRFTRDWPELDTITASVSSSATSLTVADGTRYNMNHLIELEQEVMRCTASGTGTTVPVQRGLRGTSPVTHVNATTVLLEPAFFAIEYLDALSDALRACFPLLYRSLAVDYTGISETLTEYTLPNLSGLNAPMPYIYQIEVEGAGSIGFRRVRDWEPVRGDSPFLRFREPLTASATLRIRGFAPFAPFTLLADELHPLFPSNAEHLLPIYAASALLASGEAARVRSDTGVTDDREQANRTGSSMAASSSLLQRFRLGLTDAAMPPMPRPIVRIY